MRKQHRLKLVPPHIIDQDCHSFPQAHLKMLLMSDMTSLFSKFISAMWLISFKVQRPGEGGRVASPKVKTTPTHPPLNFEASTRNTKLKWTHADSTCGNTKHITLHLAKFTHTNIGQVSSQEHNSWNKFQKRFSTFVCARRYNERNYNLRSTRRAHPNTNTTRQYTTNEV